MFPLFAILAATAKYYSILLAFTLHASCKQNPVKATPVVNVMEHKDHTISEPPDPSPFSSPDQPDSSRESAMAYKGPGAIPYFQPAPEDISMNEIADNVMDLKDNRVSESRNTGPRSNAEQPDTSGTNDMPYARPGALSYLQPAPGDIGMNKAVYNMPDEELAEDASIKFYLKILPYLKDKAKKGAEATRAFMAKLFDTALDGVSSLSKALVEKGFNKNVVKVNLKVDPAKTVKKLKKKIKRLGIFLG